MHVARGGLGVAVVNGKIYAIGGSTLKGGGGTQSGPLPQTGGPVSTNEEYDPATNTWTTKASMPTARFNFAIVAYQNKIYCIGGTLGVESTHKWIDYDVNEAYDPATNTWETKSSMPTPRDSLQAHVVNDKFYLIGGYRPDNSSFGASTSSLNEVYDPATDTWAQKAPSPYSTYGYSSAVVNDEIYFICGSNDRQGTTLNQIYHTQTDTWTFGSSAPTFFMSGTAAATTGAMAPKRIYVINQPVTDTAAYPNAPLYSTQIYDPKTDNWVAGADLPTNRANLAIAVMNDTLYAIGGQVFTYSSIYSTPYGPSVTPMATNEQYIPEGYGTPDPTYQTPTPSPSLSPSSTPAPSPSASPTPSPTLPSPSSSPTQQPTQSPEPQPTTLPIELTYVAIAIAATAIIAATALILKKRK
jgi:N-acetylneuraminic acid mutarotase